MIRTASARPAIEWGWAGSALAAESGDLHVVAPFAEGALVALIDGLGHGEEAAAAASTAVTILEAHPEESVQTLLLSCHEGMRKTRGAVMSLASFDARNASMTWTGVGNVAAVLLRGNAAPEPTGEALVARGGVVGYQLPLPRVRTLRIWRGDVLVMTTDGIQAGFVAGLSTTHPPQEIAESILATYSTGTDDARVVVARYLGLEYAL
jgi:negative regulator of sigma-B (phosphoserine phosphatase)